MASEAQKQARKRRKERHRLLMEAGKKADATVGSAERQAAEAAERAARLEEEASDVRSALGSTTNELAEVRKELALKITLLEGLEDELKQASAMVAEMKAETDAAKSELARATKELTEARAADSDARSLRNRLKAKSDEIIKLVNQIRRMKEFLDRHNLLKPYLNLNPETAASSAVPAAGIEAEPAAEPAGE